MMAIEDLLNFRINEIFQVLINEDNENFILTDTCILASLDDSCIQIIIHYDIIVRIIKSVNDVKILGEYEPQQIKLKPIGFKSFTHNNVISQIKTYTKDDSYTFGLEFLNAEGIRILTFSLGFDELQLLSSNEFTEMINNYIPYSVTTLK